MEGFRLFARACVLALRGHDYKLVSTGVPWRSRLELLHQGWAYRWFEL